MQSPSGVARNNRTLFVRSYSKKPLHMRGFFRQMLRKKESDLLFVFFFFSIGTDGPLRVRRLATAHRMP